MNNICKLQSWDTQLYADCVEFCPYEPYLSIAVCGNYQLCEAEAARVGRLSVHSINAEDINLAPKHVIDTPGILDIKWCRKLSQGQVVLAAANAKGLINLYLLGSDQLITQCHEQAIGDSERLALFCDWFDGHKIAVSDSKGEISCLTFDGQTLEVLDTWKGHEYEAWVASFDRHSDQLIYSGGDDCCFRLWDLRDTTKKAVFTNNKAHQMGVTSIETSPHNSNLLATGSYDERLLLWDKRHMKTWCSETNLGGGVWKIRWEPHDGQYLLVAAMHNGFHIVDIRPQSLNNEGLNFEPCLVDSYSEHSSLAYGCDWSRQRLTSGRRMLATCSFYDHSLHAWTWMPQS